MVAGGAWLLWRESDDLGLAVRQLSWWRVLISGALALAGTYLIGRIWRALLSGMGIDPPALEADAVFFVSQLGKYIPGSVWPVLAQMQFGQRWKAPKRVMLAANVLLLAIVTASGIAIAAILLPWSSSAGLARYWWLLLLLPVLAACLHPRVVPAVLDWLLARAGREPLDIRVSTRGLLAALSWSVAAWLVLGLHLLVLVTAYDSVGVADLAVATGGMGLAWAAGIAFIPAPAGAGVRDGILALTLSPLVGTTPAIGIALASRVLLLAADVLLAGAGTLVRRRGPAPTDG